MSLTIDELSQPSCSRRRTSYAAPARSDHTGLGAFRATVFAPGLVPCAAFAPGRDPHAWAPHGHGRLAGDGVGHGAPLTNDHRVLNRASWSARQGSRMLLRLLATLLVPPEATLVLGADDTVERRSGRKINATGCYRDAVRSSTSHVIRCFGLKWGAMMLLVAVPWSHRVWAVPLLTAWCWPADTRGPRRHKTSIDWVRQMRQPVRRWLPARRLVLVVDGGFAAVSLAWACVNSRIAMGSRLRGEAALSHPPAPQPPGKHGRKPAKGRRQRRLQAWASRSDTPWEDVAVAWYGGQRQQLWGFAHTALWDHPRLVPRHHPLWAGG